MRADLPIHYYNPELTPEWLQQHCPVEPWYSRLLEIDYSIIRKPDSDILIPVSLFDSNLHDHTGLTRNDPDHWHQKYYSSLLANIARLGELNGDVAVEMFVDPLLAPMVLDGITDDRVNFHVMKHTAIGATGMFWRFLVSDIVGARRCRAAVEMDIDLDWRDFFPMLTDYFPVSPVFYPRGEKALRVYPGAEPQKYTPVCAGLFSYRMRDVSFNVAEMVCRYWNYCNNLLSVIEPKNEFNMPFTHHPCGFGNTWNFYGNDERFLCKILYYVLRRKACLHFLMKREDMDNPLEAEKADMEFTRSHGGNVYGI